MTNYFDIPTEFINPFLKDRRSKQPSLYAKLPMAPKNASPVPRLTSLYDTDTHGDYGDRAYPGNCSGELIKDLLLYFAPRTVADPMTGSGTCRDVCDELAIPCESFDLHQGYDACDASGLPTTRKFDVIWAHPPYFRQKLYCDDSRDLSRAPTLHAFIERYAQFIRNCASALTAQGKLIILMGDYCDREDGFIPLVYWTKQLAFESGLKQHCTDIIRFSHGASSSRKTYSGRFIPGLHDTCVVFERA